MPNLFEISPDILGFFWIHTHIDLYVGQDTHKIDSCIKLLLNIQENASVCQTDVFTKIKLHTFFPQYKSCPIPICSWKSKGIPKYYQLMSSKRMEVSAPEL